MKKQNILMISSRQEFRAWLVENSQKEKECWLHLKRGKPLNSNIFYYLDAVEEALCFGWIDSTQTRINGIMYQRFTPRKKNSSWTELNKERARRLEHLGLMTDSGRKVLPDMSFQFDSDVVNALKDANVWPIFIKFPELYQRIRIYNVAFYKDKDQNTYQKVLDHLIKETAQGKMFGQWNDYGRLMDY